VLLLSMSSRLTVRFRQLDFDTTYTLDPARPDQTFRKNGRMIDKRNWLVGIWQSMEDKSTSETHLRHVERDLLQQDLLYKSNSRQ